MFKCRGIFPKPYTNSANLIISALVLHSMYLYMYKRHHLSSHAWPTVLFMQMAEYGNRCECEKSVVRMYQIPSQFFQHVVYTKTHTLYSLSVLQTSGMQWLSNGLVRLSALHTQKQHRAQEQLLQPGLTYNTLQPVGSRLSSHAVHSHGVCLCTSWALLMLWENFKGSNHMCVSIT